MGQVVVVLGIMALFALVVFWVWMLYEIATREDWVFRQAGQSKALWFVVVFVLQFFGTLGYFFLVRDKLRIIEDEARTKPLAS